VDNGQVERNFFTHRIGIFLLASSILFLGFVGLISRSNASFLTIVASVGLVSSLVMLAHSWYAKCKLDREYPYKREHEDRYFGWLKGRYVGNGASLMFAILWVLSIAAIHCDWLGVRDCLVPLFSE